MRTFFLLTDQRNMRLFWSHKFNFRHYGTNSNDIHCLTHATHTKHPCIRFWNVIPTCKYNLWSNCITKYKCNSWHYFIFKWSIGK